MPRLFGDTILRALDANGEPVSGGELRCFLAGTTTPVTTFSDAGLNVSQPVPVVADSSGVIPPVYVPDGSYKVTLRFPGSAELPGSPIDNIPVGGGSLVTPEGGVAASIADLFSGTAALSGLQVRPGSALAKLGIDLARTLTGASATGVNATLFNITADDAEISGANFLNHYTFQSVFGGGTGGRQGIFALMSQTAASDAATANRNYVAASMFIETSSGDGGTNLTDSAEGAYFGINPYVLLKPGATNVYNASGGEVNWAVETGASVKYLFGLQLVTHARHRVAGVDADAMLGLSAQTGAAKMGAGISFNSINGAFPLGTSAPLIVTDAATVAYGIDFRDLTATAALFAGPKMRLEDAEFVLGASSGVATISVNDEGATINADLTLSPAGTGVVRYGVYETTAPTATGFITIKSESGQILQIPARLVP